MRPVNILAIALCFGAASAAADVPAASAVEKPVLVRKTDDFDHVVRDGVKLKTLILVPKGAQDAPMLLAEPLRIAGQPFAQLFASTSGSDADWVVKIIDVWPDEVPESPKLGGYQQMLSADIFRGRYREDFSVARPAKPGQVLPYRLPLPHASHTFLRGRRIWHTAEFPTAIELPVVP